MYRRITGFILLVVLCAGAAQASPIPFSPELWIMEPDGTDQRMLLSNAGGPVSWAPDSRRLVTEYMDVVDTSTGERYSLASGYWADWSPTSEDIVFSTAAEGANRDIYLVNAQTQERRLLASTINDDVQPEWSPDASQVAFISTGYSAPPGSLFVVSSDGDDLRELSSVEDGVDNFSWSPDGTTLAFTTEERRLYLTDVGGANQRLVGDYPAIGDPVWCGDGTLFFGTLAPGDSAVMIYQRDPSGTVTPFGEGSPMDCSVSDRLAFFKKGDIYVADIGEPGSPNLTVSDLRTDNHARWSPDGQHLVFTSTREYPPAELVERKVHLSLNRHLRTKATFAEGSAQCFGNMKIQRLAPNGWRAIGTRKLVPWTKTFSLRPEDRPGFYRAVASGGYTEYGEGYCERTVSNIVRHRH